MATKEEDVVEHVVQASTHDTVLFFTTLGRVFKLKVYEIPAASRTAKGQSIVNVLSLSPEEKVTSLVAMKKDDPAKYLFMTTNNGTVKKTALADFANIRQSGIVAIKLDAGDKLSWVKKTTGDENIIISTSMAQAIRFKESDARPMGRATRGVRGIRLRKDDTVVGMDVISGEDQLMLVIMQNGYGKITKSNQFSSHNRGGVGIKAGVVTAKTGKAVDVRIINSREDDVLIISKQGQVIRLKLSAIPVIGRSTQGVRIMRMSSGDEIASIALLPKVQEEITPEEEAKESKEAKDKKDDKTKA
jgi:DNA gyrase subunit A